MAKVATTYYKDLARWDVKTYLNKLTLAHSDLVSFGKLLKRIPIEFEELQENKEYPIIGVRSYGKGLYHNRVAKGSDLITPSTKAYQKIKQGMLFWCKVDTKNGAFGITQKQHEGYYASNNMIQVEIDKEKILPHFLQLLFTYDFFQKYLDSHVVGLTNRQYISFTELVNIKIPLPSITEQQKIVDMWYKAQDESQQCLEQVKSLKQQIDDYLMSELGITVQKQEKTKIFTTHFKDLERWSLSHIAGKTIYTSNIKMTTMFNVAKIIMGSSPDGQSYNEKQDGLPFYQGKTLFSDMCLQPANIYTNQPSKISQKGDILMSVRAPVGTVNYNPFIKICIGRGLCAFRPNPKIILSDYLFYILTYFDFLVQGNQGSTFESITALEVQNIKIPLPPMDKQQEIVNHISQLREQISQLTSQSQQIIETARNTIKNKIII